MIDNNPAYAWTLEDEADGSEQLTPIEAFTLLALMQDAVDSVPSYVETHATQTWIENSLEQ